jgi:hypothetical protein
VGDGPQLDQFGQLRVLGRLSLNGHVRRRHAQG